MIPKSFSLSILSQIPSCFSKCLKFKKSKTYIQTHLVRLQTQIIYEFYL